MPSRPFISVEAVSKEYRLAGRTVTALQDVSFEVPTGGSLVVTGYSGCGKSTLLGLLGALDRPSAGDIALDGVRYSSLNEAEMTRLRRKTVGFVFQTFNLFPALTAEENVLLAARIAGVPRHDAAKQTAALLEATGMTARARHRPPQLSGGEQQRVAVARALVFRPRLLLADEPTGDLDSRNGELVADLIFGLCRDSGSTCVLATHNLDVARRASQRIALKDGSIVENSAVAGTELGGSYGCLGD
jgi:putative ABC transport system ATP-binding protein